MDAQDIICLLARESSETRLPAMLDALEGVDAATFWTVFQADWPVCDDTWQHRRRLLRVLKQRQPFAPHMIDANRELYERLPDEILLHRGCDMSRVKGISWTVDRQVAEGFARGHRMIYNPAPTVISATVYKFDVLMVNAVREESEILINPAVLI